MPQRVVITGGTEGIGKGIAANFLKCGAKVLIVSRKKEKGAKAVEELQKTLDSNNKDFISFAVGDVSKEEDWASVVQAAQMHLGGVDVLVANAGIYPQVKMHEMSLQEWNEVINTNLTGTFLSVKALLPELKKSSAQFGGSRIILTSSITGPSTGYPGWSHYGASKAGQLGFMKTVALEIAKDNITINSVLPGNIDNGSLQALGADYVKGMTSAIPLARLGTVDDVAAAVLFFASPQASFITGQTLTVDGGQTLPESAQALDEI
eukprot:Nk52_evm82s352 gene=Nk52_evmTU82s352